MADLYVKKIRNFDAPTQIINEPQTTKSYIRLDTQEYNANCDMETLNNSYSTNIVVEDNTPITYIIDDETITFNRDDKVYSISKLITKTYIKENL